MPNSSPLFRSPSAIPGESPFSQRVTLTPTKNLAIQSQQPLWLSLWPRPMLSPSFSPSTSSSETAEWSRCSPPLRTPSARNAGNSATSLPAAPAHCQFVPSARSPTPKQSIAALTLPALRVAISALSLPAVHPQWHAVLTAKKSTLRAAGIAPPAQRPLQRHQSCDLDRRRTAWISLKTRLAVRQSFPQYQVPLPEPRVPLYSPAMLLHLGREPNGPSPSPTSPQERGVMNLLTPTPLRALPTNGELFHS